MNLSMQDHINVQRIAGTLFKVPEIRSFVLPGNPSSKVKRAPMSPYLHRAFAAPMTGNLFVLCLFYRPNRQRIDADNMMKHFLDSATGVCWVDDSQVTAQLGGVEFDAERPRTVVAIGEHHSSMQRSGLPRQFTCGHCGSTFASRQHSPTFCSPKCFTTARGQKLMATVPCARCGSLFKRTRGGERYCRRECGIGAATESRRTRGPKPMCRTCGVPVSRHGYARCRACWRADAGAAGNPQ